MCARVCVHKEYGTRPKFSAQVCAPRNLGGELGSCAIHLTFYGQLCEVLNSRIFACVQCPYGYWCAVVTEYIYFTIVASCVQYFFLFVKCLVVISGSPCVERTFFFVFQFVFFFCYLFESLLCGDGTGSPGQQFGSGHGSRVSVCV